MTEALVLEPSLAKTALVDCPKRLQRVFALWLSSMAIQFLTTELGAEWGKLFEVHMSADLLRPALDDWIGSLGVPFTPASQDGISSWTLAWDPLV